MNWRKVRNVVAAGLFCRILSEKMTVLDGKTSRTFRVPKGTTVIDNLPPEAAIVEFDYATWLSIMGVYDESIKAWDKLIAKGDMHDKSQLYFFAICHLRKANDLMREEKHQEVKTTLEKVYEIFSFKHEDEIMRPGEIGFLPADRANYFYELGCACGLLGQYDEMDKHFASQLCIARKMEDEESEFRCWEAVLTLAREEKQWQYLDDKCREFTAHLEANPGFYCADQLILLTGVYRLAALAGLGRPQEAKELSEKLLDEARSKSYEEIAEKIQTEITELVH